MTFVVQKTQLFPYQKMGTLTMDTYEKAYRVAEKWIESMKDSYDYIANCYRGPSFFYTITEML